MSTTLRLRYADIAYDVRAVPCEHGWDVHVGDAIVTTRRCGHLAPAVRVEGATVAEHLLDVDGRLVRATVARTADRVHVAIDGATYVLVLDDGASAGAGATVGTGRILAPMPGKVVQVLVSVGDHVAAGDPVVVLEAMKMETTLVTDVDGTVGAVHATTGATVDGDAVLVEVTPDE